MRWPALVVILILTTGCTKLAPTKNPNEYVWLTRYDVKTLDPAAIQDWTTGKVLSYLYPSIGDLCTIDSEDYKLFRLKLKGNKFSNGEAVTSEDIRFTIERCLHAANQSSVGNQFAMEIQDAAGYSDGKIQHLDGVQLQGDTVLINLDRPDRAFESKLKNSAFGVVNHKLVELTKPIADFKPGYGAGKWTLDAFTPGTEWRIKQSVTGSQIRFRFVGDSATRRSLFDKGEADYAMFGAHEAGVVQGSPSLTKGGPTTLVYLQFNPKTKPELTKELRYEIGGIVHMNTDFATLLNKMVNPASSFLELSNLQPLPSSGVVSAKIQSKGHFEITYAEIGMQNPSVEAIVTSLRHAGLDITGRAMPSGAMLEKNAKGEIPILFTGWQPDFDGALNTIPMLFHSKSSENHSGYSNPEVDRLIDLAQQGIDTDKNIQKAYDLIERDAPGVPLYIQRDLVLQKKEPPLP